MHSVLKIVRLLSGAIGTNLGFRLEKALAEKDYTAAVLLRQREPDAYVTPESYLKDAQVAALVRKLEGLPTGVDLHRVAEETFLQCETRCRETNDRLARFVTWFERGFHGDAVDHELYQFLSVVRREIAQVLGPIPKDLVPRLSGGSTFFDKGDEITIPHKMGSRPSCTQEGWSVIGDLWRDTAWWRAHDTSPVIVPGNRFTSVAKDSTKNRGICVEPSLNVAYQLAIGAYIRSSLYSVGIQIDGLGSSNAQTIHREAALRASKTGDLATIDLSNASDTIAYMLVKLLLPKGWFALLSALRSPYTRFRGEWVKLHKFSSMGNGFTFELETLLFYALAKSVGGWAKAYGDDILLPTRDSVALVTLLTLLGFEVNQGKSFMSSSGSFRESCGGDYFRGVDVRPIFLKTMPSSPGEWMVLANQIRLIGIKLKGSIDSVAVAKARAIAIGNIPMKFRLYGPPWAGDSVLHEEDRSKWVTRPAMVRIPHPKRQCHHVSGDILPETLPGGYLELKCLKAQHRRVRLTTFPGGVQLASALLGAPSQGVIPRDGISGYKAAWLPTAM